MHRTHLWLLLLTGAGVAAGLALAYWWPQQPLLAYWLFVALVLGIAIAMTAAFDGIQRRLGWMVWTFALLIGASLFTTQLAARRAISSTHLVDLTPKVDPPIMGQPS
jgi:hypothetical protein